MDTSCVLVLATCAICEETVVLVADSVAQTLSAEWRSRLATAVCPSHANADRRDHEALHPADVDGYTLIKE